MPNASDPTGGNQYNYTYQTVTDWPRNDQVVRLDWNIGPATTAYGRLQFGDDKRAGAASTFGATSGWPQMVTRFESEAVSYVNTLLHAFSPTLFSEVTVGVNWGYQHASPLNQAELDRNDRSKVLPGLPPFFPAANPLNLLPQATFNGTLPGPAATIGSFGIERRFPFYGFSTLWNFSGNLTRVAGPHNIKMGIFVEHTTRPVRQRSSFNGTLSFNTDGSNPLNTNIGFANALLGAVTSYQESDAQPSAHGLFVNTEFYVQDNWRLKRSFTVDAGVRFYYITPTTSQGDKVVQFEHDAFSASSTPLLFQPITTPQGRRAVNPVTGEILPAVYVGRLVPGSGDFTNGMVLYDGTPQRTSPFRVAPRLGFAWDVTGDGNTAIRGGAGVFYDRYGENDILELTELPPLVTYLHDRLHDDSGPPGQPTDNDDQRSASNHTVRPTSGLQLEPRRAAADRVECRGRSGVRRERRAQAGDNPRDQRSALRLRLPAIEPGSVQRAGGTGPASARRPPAAVPLDTPQSCSANSLAYSDYHSIQFAANRRRSADGLAFGAAYTYQLVNKTLGSIDPFLSDNRARNYNSVGRRPHALTINYSVPGTEPQPRLGQRPRESRLRQLADFRDYFVPERRPGRLHLWLFGHAHGRTERQRVCQRRGEPARYHLRPDAAESRAHIRAPVQDGVHHRTRRSIELRQRARR